MTEDQLITIAYEIDNVLVATCNKYQMDGLSVSAVILARLLKLNQEFGSEDDFIKLLMSASTGKEIDSIPLH